MRSKGGTAKYEGKPKVVFATASVDGQTISAIKAERASVISEIAYRAAREALDKRVFVHVS